MVKLHPDLLYDWVSNPLRHSNTLKELAERYNFMIMADLKLVDVPAISYKQLVNPNYLINTWADFITVMSVNYTGIVTYLASKDITRNIIPVPVTEMNVNGSSLFQEAEYQNFVAGLLDDGGVQIVVSQRSYAGLLKAKNIMAMTPGVTIHPATGNNPLQKYRSIQDAICQDGNQIVIIGGSIINVEHMSNILTNIQQAAKQSWDALVLLG
jgi:orotidine-5'-phosphate decarboxylase